MIPYSELSETQKEQDRKWARRIIKEVIAPEAADFATKTAQEIARLVGEL